MNQNSWEVAQRSSTVGIEYNKLFYDQLRAATRAALDAEGLTLDNLATTNAALEADAAEQQRLKEDAERRAKEDKIGNSLFLTAAIHLLPRIDGNTFDFGDNIKFKTTDRQEAYDILDSVVWMGGLPHWMIGYRYTDHAALLMPAAPPLSYYQRVRNTMFFSLALAIESIVLFRNLMRTR